MREIKREISLRYLIRCCLSCKMVSWLIITYKCWNQKAETKRFWCSNHYTEYIFLGRTITLGGWTIGFARFWLTWCRLQATTCKLLKHKLETNKHLIYSPPDIDSIRLQFHHFPSEIQDELACISLMKDLMRSFCNFSMQVSNFSGRAEIFNEISLELSWDIFFLNWSDKACNPLSKHDLISSSPLLCSQYYRIRK